MTGDGVGQALSVWLIPLIVAITFHEAAHGWVADKLGDDTARMLGRVSFNPIRHVDPFGTIILPGLLLLANTPFMFGYAKPVPVNFRRLNNPKRDAVWVALAGPAINIALALLTGWVMHPLGQLDANRFTLWLWENLHNFMSLNVMLAVFNMLPILPLDGGRVLRGLLPEPLGWRYARSEPYGMVILLLLIVVAPIAARQFGSDVNPLGAVLGPAVSAVYGAVATLSGWT